MVLLIIWSGSIYRNKTMYKVIASGIDLTE